MWDDIPGTTLFLVVTELEQLIAAEVELDVNYEALIQLARGSVRAGVGVIVEADDVLAKGRYVQRGVRALSLLRQVCKGWCYSIDSGLQTMYMSR